MEPFSLLFLITAHITVLRINGLKINLNMMQHTSLSPDRKVVVIVGDDPDGLLIDANTGKVCHPSH
jgi:hypothetical protein